MNKTPNYKNILIYRIGHLGDTLVSLPAFWAIKKAFPDARLTILTNIDAQKPNYIMAQSILPPTGLFENWLFYPNNTSEIKKIFGFIQLFREIRRQRFDCLFYLMTRNRSVGQIHRDVKFFQLAGIKKIFGTGYLLKNLVAESVEKPLPAIESESDFFLNSLAFDGLPLESDNKPDMLLSPAEVEFAENWLAENCGMALAENRLLAVAPGSKWSSKVWAEERFAQVVSRLIETKNIFPVVFGGNEDREKGNRLLQIWKTGANAAGSLNIRQAAAALEKCRLYLGNDTGTMHLAATVGTPCVAVFAAIDIPGRWNPFGDKHAIFRQQIECEGCLSAVCPFENQCLKEIKAEDVLAMCEKFLEEN